MLNFGGVSLVLTRFCLTLMYYMLDLAWAKACHTRSRPTASLGVHLGMQNDPHVLHPFPKLCWFPSTIIGSLNLKGPQEMHHGIFDAPWKINMEHNNNDLFGSNDFPLQMGDVHVSAVYFFGCRIQTLRPQHPPCSPSSSPRSTAQHCGHEKKTPNLSTPRLVNRKTTA